MAETRTMLAELPDSNKLVAFDRNGRVMVTMAENAEGRLAHSSLSLCSSSSSESWRRAGQ